MYQSIFIEIYKRAAALVGADIHFTSQKPPTGQIIFPNGQRVCFTDGNLGLNSSSINDLVRDKHLCDSYFNSLGFHYPRTVLIDPRNGLSEEITDFCQTVGFPVFMKPKTGTQGEAVYRVNKYEDFHRIFSSNPNLSKSTILQEACQGEELRVVVLQGDVVLAYRREPMKLIGDGVRSIQTLMQERIDFLNRRGGKITIDMDDPKIDFSLAQSGFSRHDIPEVGCEIQPLANLNLSEGATPIECTQEFKARFGDLCRRMAEHLPMDYFGMDFVIDNRPDSVGYWIIEVNREPGYRNFWAHDPAHQLMVQSIFNRQFQILAERSGWDWREVSPDCAAIATFEIQS